MDELAHRILCLARLRDPGAGTSLNVGVVEGGTRSNVTAGRAVGRIDVRVASAAEQKRVTDALAALRPVDQRTRVEVTGDWNRPLFKRTEQVPALAESALRRAALLSEDLPEVSVGGASDGNFVVARGYTVLDGIGAVGPGAHARSENTSVSGMVARAAPAAPMLVSPAAG